MNCPLKEAPTRFCSKKSSKNSKKKCTKLREAGVPVWPFTDTKGAAKPVICKLFIISMCA